MVEQGQRFSQNYIARGEPSGDSSRMRRRLYRLYTELKVYHEVTGELIEFATGAHLPDTMYGTDWEHYFSTAQLRDLLDTVTVAAARLKVKDPRKKEFWISGVRLIFVEENVRYRVDDQGGVHFAIDGEFAHNQASAIAALHSPRYAAARAHFEAAQKALDSAPPRTREAIRQTFEAAETVFKLMFSGVSVLGTNEVTKKLRPQLEATLAGTEKDAAFRLVESFADWVTSAHPFRHGQGVETPDDPSISTAVLSVSLGASYIRWLADLDGSANS
ncbi:MAG: hypothetical protein BGO58_11690 [Sphingopyxis sp. 65-8]|nr:hypothetical protein [Sphingopyxis terrae]OJW23439.1 MAG: hypothetical protein BGO58_11690 [Sphingopyxis sp. 65-8]